LTFVLTRTTLARTLNVTGAKDFSHLLENLSSSDLAKVKAGFSLFAKGWVTAPSSTRVRDGLGPLFNAVSCMSCHQGMGRGKPQKSDLSIDHSLLFRLSVTGKSPHGGPLSEPTYGGQFQPRSIISVKSEGQVKVEYIEEVGQFLDGEKYSLRRPVYSFSNLAYGAFQSDVLISPRIAPHVAGLGLLEKISRESLLANVDVADVDGDGISGRVNTVWSPTHKKHMIGRFGWKANQATVADQNAGAFSGDLGITSMQLPNESCSSLQFDCASSLTGGAPEINKKLLGYVNLLISSIDAPRVIKNEFYTKGLKVFRKMQCQKCHVESFKIGEREIRPYSDLLLHDLGERLADKRSDYLASGSEWKTPPLWGVGKQSSVNGHTNFLHDGRARNLTEAILWHGGEASGSKNAFLGLSSMERKELFSFLNSL